MDTDMKFFEKNCNAGARPIYGWRGLRCPWTSGVERELETDAGTAGGGAGDVAAAAEFGHAGAHIGEAAAIRWGCGIKSLAVVLDDDAQGILRQRDTEPQLRGGGMFGSVGEGLLDHEIEGMPLLSTKRRLGQGGRHIETAANGRGLEEFPGEEAQVIDEVADRVVLRVGGPDDFIEGFHHV